MIISVPYWNNDVEHDQPALWEAGQLVMSHGDFSESVNSAQRKLASSDKRLVIVFTNGRAHAAIAIHAALEAGHAVMLASDNISVTRRGDLIESYNPGFTVAVDDQGLHIMTHAAKPFPIDDELALLLSTSGSTGSQKYVRLSHKAVRSNALAIAQSLDMAPEDIGAAHLDLNYSYGWSVLASHLSIGASVSFVSGGVTDSVFWKQIRDSGVTQFTGVPTHYEIIQRLRAERVLPASITLCTQAGGKLHPEIRQGIHSAMTSRNGRFVVMYGQTEAGPRMSCLSHEDFSQYPDSVGKALAGGLFSVEFDRSDQSVSGPVCYTGDNVMLGYASGWKDLARGDENQGRLETGDLGYVNDDGFLFLSGRNDRLVKIHGLRVQLDDIEHFCPEYVKVISGPNCLQFMSTHEVDSWKNNVTQQVAKHTTLPSAALRFYQIETWPMTDRGKLDYKSLQVVADNAC